MKLIRSLAIVALLPMMNFVHAETIYQIEKFSDRYSAKVIVDPANIKDWNVRAC